jgi:membrane fusion protein (multidrug efflux system)
MAFLAFIVFAGICAWWIVNGWYIEETDDAFIKADSISISSKIGGYVEEVLVTDNQGVQKGSHCSVLIAAIATQRSIKK